ncbi:hypothetical protein BGW41_003370 [Actinomortierella wolfii]|nr:hypothetical protein BGW41_003370 [Actinomortierella wolfii]
MATTGLIAALYRGGTRNVLPRITTPATTQWTLTQPNRVPRIALRANTTPVPRTFTTSTSVRLAQHKQDGNGNSPKDGDPTTPPPTSLGASKTIIDSGAVPDPMANIQSLEDFIRELNKDATTAAEQSRPGQSKEADVGGDQANQEEQQGHEEQQQQQRKKRDWSSWRRSKMWRYLWVVFYWSCLGSLPIHLMMIKNETKAVQEKLEWKIAVLQDMRDKLARGESIEEEEALLSVGMDRSKRELQHQVDDRMFEELIKSAESLDIEIGKSVKVPISELQEAADTQASSEEAPSPAPVSRVFPSDATE